MRWFIYHLILKHLIIADLHRRAHLSMIAMSVGYHETPGHPYGWDKMHWADELALKWGFDCKYVARHRWPLASR